jgi:hypothetical protein
MYYLNMEDQIINKIIGFIKSIGIGVFFETIEGETFVPGITIRDGAVIVDREKLSYPGDLLHEAGHIAVMSSEKRKYLNDNIDAELADAGNEMAAIAWSYAVCRHLQIDPAVVFHEHGYKGGSDAILENFNTGHYIGVPLLQWYGMTYEPRQAKELQTEPYPNMVNWMSQH